MNNNIHRKNKDFQKSLQTQRRRADFRTLSETTKRIQKLRISILETAPDETLTIISDEISRIERDGANLQDTVAKHWLLKFVDTLQAMKPEVAR